jgi:hypothetical protein
LRFLSKSIYILYHNSGMLVNHFLIKNQFNRLKILFQTNDSLVISQYDFL